MRQPYKLAKFRWDCGGREVVGVKVEFLKVTQTEEAAVRVERPIMVFLRFLLKSVDFRQIWA